MLARQTTAIAPPASALLFTNVLDWMVAFALSIAYKAPPGLTVFVTEFPTNWQLLTCAVVFWPLMRMGRISEFCRKVPLTSVTVPPVMQIDVSPRGANVIMLGSQT
jgi:hypothetical protein